MVRRLTGTRRARRLSVKPKGASDAGQAGGTGAGGSGPAIVTDLEANIEQIQQIMNRSSDLIVRRIVIGDQVDAAIIYLTGMVNDLLVHQAIVAPLLEARAPLGAQPLHAVETGIVSAGGVERVHTIEMVLDGISGGRPAILISGAPAGLLVATQGWEKRSVEEPRSEVVVRGPRQSFTETLQDSVAMMRREIRDPGLTVERLRVGRRTHTDIALIYLSDIADDDLVAEVRRRVSSIDADSVLDSGYIEQYIEEQTYSPFPTVGYSERPDAVAGRILEGRVAIAIDGSPEVLTVPHLFFENFQSPEDYYFRTLLTTLLRWFRYLAFAISIAGPGIYVALATYHQELIPTQLLLTIASSQEGVPFPTVVEVIGLGLVYEILREAGVRLPRPVGQAVSIVGVLVIGQAAVSAGFVEASVVIVVSMTAIASFLNPHLTEAGLIARLGLSVIAGVFGGFGVVIGLIALLVHLASLRSFGTSYLAPALPPNVRELFQDVIVRAPIWAMHSRPTQVTGDRSAKQPPGQAPRPPASPKGTNRP